MALIAHYPLNGGTEDYSGYGSHGTATSVEWVDGKTGLSAKLDGASNRISIPTPPIGTHFSVALWHYSDPEVGGSSWRTLIGAASNIHPLIFSSRSNLGVFDGGFNSFNYTVPINVWVHISVVYDILGKSANLFINGVFESSVSNNYNPTSHPITAIGGAVGYSYSSGYIGDLRIYDHALSEKEIKELAKAKVLHYKFDEHEEPTENLLVDGGVRNWSIGKLAGSHSYTFLNERGDVTITSTVGGQFRITVPLSKLNNGKEYSISYDLEVTKGTLSMSDWCDTPLYNRKIVGGRYSATGVRDEYNNVYRFIDLNISTGAEVTLRNIQLEEKDHATPFTPTSRLALVKDSSGFGNDGTVAVATAPTWSEDSPVGRGSMDFRGAKFISVNHKIPLSDDFTVSFWANINPTSTATLGCSRTSLGKGFSIFILNKAIRWDTGDQQWSTGHVVKPNQWVHYTLVRRRNAKELYENGVLVKSTTYTGSMTNLGSLYSIGMSQIGGSGYGNPLKGTVSDYRIYATALTPEDILELYQTRASIDNLGNLFVQEIDEINNTSKEVDSRGIARFKEFNEVDGENKMSIKNDGVVYVNEIMEA